MTSNYKIRKLLVILRPDLIEPENPLDSVLMKRAISVAKKAHCTLELFQVCYDSDLESHIFSSDQELPQKRKEATDREATSLAEIAQRVQQQGVEVEYEARWDNPRADAILRKIVESRPDLVMKQMREHSYVLGFSSNTDWELARRSPASLWLVSDTTSDVDRIVAAVGHQTGKDATTVADYEVVNEAKVVADLFDSELYPVNAYQLPRASAFATGDGAFAPATPTAVDEELRQELVDRNSIAVKAFAAYFHVDKGNVRICEGSPEVAIPEAANQLGADLIVMGSRSLSRLERLVFGTTVEPVMADTHCDILVVREKEAASMPKAKQEPLKGVPAYDLEMSITHPEQTFETPRKVVEANTLSFSLRRRILQAWEHDLRAQMTAENEGGPVVDLDSDVLDEIKSAQHALEEQRKEREDHPESLSVAS